MRKELLDKKEWLQRLERIDGKALDLKKNIEDLEKEKRDLEDELREAIYREDKTKERVITSNLENIEEDIKNIRIKRKTIMVDNSLARNKETHKYINYLINEYTNLLKNNTVKGREVKNLIEQSTEEYLKWHESTWSVYKIRQEIEALSIEPINARLLKVNERHNIDPLDERNQSIIIEIEESLNKLNNMIKEWESTKSGVAESRRSFRHRLHGKDI